MDNDLNRLSVPVAATGDYGLNSPVNAWPNAGSDVVVSMRQIGAYLYQTGYDVGGDTLYMRRRLRDGGDWEDWSKFPPDPVPPEPPEEPEPEPEPEPENDA